MREFSIVLAVLGVMGITAYTLLHPLFSFVLNSLADFGYMLEHLI
jgi:hypothetical protein